MGKIPQGILGGVSGKVGGLVGSSWKGINVIKTKPLSVANPQTAGQVAQRSKFSNVVAFAGIILATVIKPLWDRFASKMSGYNDFIQTNIAEFAAALPATAANLVISNGKMAATAISSALVTNGETDVVISWSDDSGEGFKLGTDESYIVVVNETNGEVKGFADASDRSVTNATVSMDNAVTTGDTVNCYLAFKRVDGTVVSNTAFLEASF